MDEPPGGIDFTKNIIVVDNDQTEAIFIEGFNGAVEDVVRVDNCYWNADDGQVELGVSYGAGEIASDPLFVDYGNRDYSLQDNSPAKGWGALGD